MSRRHEISSAPENMVWGYIDSATPPVLEIASGDIVTLHSFPAGGEETLPEDRSLVPADYLAALPANTPVKIEVGAIGVYPNANATFTEVGDLCVNEVGDGCE